MKLPGKHEVFLDVWIDGSCVPNPGYGGWAFKIIKTGKGKPYEKACSGGVSEETTNNAMELRALIEALLFLESAIKKAATKKLYLTYNTTIYSDSSYVVKGVNEWLEVWRMNSWQNSKRKEVSNAALWQRLVRIRDRVKDEIEWQIKHVSAHTGIPWNEYVDDMARGSACRVKKEA